MGHTTTTTHQKPGGELDLPVGHHLGHGEDHGLGDESSDGGVGQGVHAGHGGHAGHDDHIGIFRRRFRWGALSSAIAVSNDVLVKDGLALERMRNVDAVLFDRPDR